MIGITVKFLGVAKEAAGTAEESLEISEGSDVSALLQTIIQRHNEGLKDALLDPVTGTPITTLILLNGVEINNLKGLKTPLSDGDSLVLLSITHGG
ncbi:MAG: MoaD/ThiS family protein [Candidatus Bathyarchaeota archaeon]|jgi:molybdopterin converting factor small subunit